MKKRSARVGPVYLLGRMIVGLCCAGCGAVRVQAQQEGTFRAVSLYL
jgi:hypothetical protein